MKPPEGAPAERFSMVSRSVTLTSHPPSPTMQSAPTQATFGRPSGNMVASTTQRAVPIVRSSPVAGVHTAISREGRVRSIRCRTTRPSSTSAWSEWLGTSQPSGSTHRPSTPAGIDTPYRTTSRPETT